MNDVNMNQDFEQLGQEHDEFIKQMENTMQECPICHTLTSQLEQVCPNCRYEFGSWCD